MKTMSDALDKTQNKCFNASPPDSTAANAPMRGGAWLYETKIKLSYLARSLPCYGRKGLVDWIR